MRMPGGRLTTLAGAVLSLFIFAAVITFGMGAQDGREASRPVTTDSGEHGLEAAFRWLVASGISTESWRQPLTQLASAHPSDGNILIITWPGTKSADEGEAAALNAWIRRGNTLLLLTPSMDSPSWRKHAHTYDDDTLIEGLDLSISFTDTDSANAVSSDSRNDIELVVGNDQALFGSVRQIRARQLGPIDSEIFFSSNDHASPFRPLLKSTENHRPAIQRARADRGQIWISHFPDILSNVNLGALDNRHLLRGIVDLGLGDAGAVLFDDYRFGLSAIYDGKAFFRDPRLHQTLYALVALWLLWLIGRSPRLAPIARAQHRPSVRSLVEATGGLYSRVVSESAAGSALLNHFQRQTARRLRTGADVDLWESLGARLGHEHSALSQLRAAAEKLDMGKTQSLVKLSRLISDVKHDLYRKPVK